LQTHVEKVFLSSFILDIKKSNKVSQYMKLLMKIRAL